MPREVPWNSVDLEPEPEDAWDPAEESPAAGALLRLADYRDRGRATFRATAAGGDVLRRALEFPEDVCPCCRSLERCECQEAERSFARRIRSSSKGVARCPGCSTPLSTIVVPRAELRGARPLELGLFGAIHFCARCQFEEIARLVRVGVGCPENEEGALGSSLSGGRGERAPASGV